MVEEVLVKGSEGKDSSKDATFRKDLRWKEEGRVLLESLRWIANKSIWSGGGWRVETEGVIVSLVVEERRLMDLETAEWLSSTTILGAVVWLLGRIEMLFFKGERWLCC